MERPRAAGEGSGHSSAGWTRRNGEGSKSKKLWSRVGSFLSRRAREIAEAEREERTRDGEDRISETWNQWLSVTVLSYENLSSDPIVGARGCGIKLIKDSARNPHSMN